MAQGEPHFIVLDSEEALAKWGRERRGRGTNIIANPSPESTSIGRDPVHLVLMGEAAMALWREGRATWNAWIGYNPRADVDFSGQHFEANANSRSDAARIDFSWFVFPEGDVSFDRATFGNGEVSFDRATFSGGKVSFDNATFGDGKVSFDRATFGDGDVRFEDVTFGDGDVSFVGATFGYGNISFRGATFGDRGVSFALAIFGDGDVNFDNAILNKGGVNFSHASFGRGAIWMRNLSFAGVARFDSLEKLEHCNGFSFEGCSFDKLFTFSHKGRMGCPLDLRRTKLTHGVVLHDVHCDYVKQSDWLWRNKAADPQDSQRFRRLKELALSEANHAKALEFNAQELRSQRRHETGWLQDFLQFFYMLLSDYGRSVARPLVALGVATGLFAALYAQLSTNSKTPSFTDALPAALTYSGGNMFAFVPIGRSALEQSRADLFGDMVPYELLWIAGSQSVLSVILLFLLGLGLRNMFRL